MISAQRVPRQDDHSELATFQVLLMRKTGVGREQNLETGPLGNAQKLSIGQRAPALCIRGSDGMILQSVADGDGSPLVEKNSH